MTNKLTVGSIVLNTGRLSMLHYADQFFVAGLIIILSRYCDIVLLAQYLTLTAFWTWGAMFVDFGLNPVLIRESAEHGYNTRILIDAFAIKAIALIIVFCLFFVWNYLFQRIPMAKAVFVPVVIGIRCLNSTLSSLLAGRDRAIDAAKCQLISRIFLVLLIYFGLILEHDIGYAVGFHIVLELLLSCMLWQRTDFFLPVFSWQMSTRGLERIFRESAIVGLTGSSLFLILKQPLFWLERYAPAQAVLYGIAVRLMEMFLVPVYALLIILFPKIVRNRNKLKFTPSFIQGVSVVLLLVLFMISSFVLPEFHLFKFVALRLSPLDRSMPYWFFCTIVLSIVQILSVYLFLQKKLYLVLFASIAINGMIFLYFALLIFTGWANFLRYENSLFVIIFSFILIIAAVWRGEKRWMK